MNPEQEVLLQKILEKLDLLILQTSECNLESSSSYRFVLYLIPISGIVFGTTLLFFIFYWWYRQRMEIIRQGLYRPIEFNLKTYSFFLGLLLTFTGLVLSIVFIIALGKSTAILGGLVPLAVGLSLLSFYKFHR